MISIRLAIDDLIAKCDPVALKWPGHILWNIAMLLMLEGRAALATYFMEAAERDFDGTKMPVDETIAFLKDYARVLIGHDLVHTRSAKTSPNLTIKPNASKTRFHDETDYRTRSTRPSTRLYKIGRAHV